MFEEAAYYLITHEQEVITLIMEHLLTCLLTLLIATVVGVICGYFASKFYRLERFIVIPFEILRVIPSLALLVLFIPLIGTGLMPAVVAMIFLAIPPILLNTIVAFQSVSSNLIECAYGLGLNNRQIFWHVCVPQALPLILGGIKTAMIEVVASATLAAKIGAGGLGELIYTGLGLYRTDLLIVGGILVALLSLGLEGLFQVIIWICFPFLKHE